MTADPELRARSRYAGGLRALVGETEPVTRGMRLVYAPTFHAPLVVCVDIVPGYIELHRIPQEVLQRTFWHGGRFSVPEPNEILPAVHPSDLAEVSSEAVAALVALAHALPDRFEARGYRDGMSVGIEYASPEGTRVFGETFPVGAGPASHTVLARAVLLHCTTAFPNAEIEPLTVYFPPQS